jgi:hypothetical protein
VCSKIPSHTVQEPDRKILASRTTIHTEAAFLPRNAKRQALQDQKQKLDKTALEQRREEQAALYAEVSTSLLFKCLDRQ